MKVSKTKGRQRARPQGRAGSITLYLQRIPREKFDSLSPEDRYCLLLLGHVHNELSWLHRMAFIASRAPHKGSDLNGSANMMQTTFLVRLMIGKLHEFNNILGDPIRGFISRYFDPHSEAVGRAMVDQIRKVHSIEKWISTARNKHFLHYPKFNDVGDTLLGAEIEWHVEIVHGAKSGNTFYPSSDVLANYAWFRLANPDDPMLGFDDALMASLKLARLTLDAIERSIGHFVDIRLMSLADNEKIELPVAQNINGVRLDYFLKT